MCDDMASNFIKSEKVSDIIKMNDFYADEIKNNLNNIKLKFDEIKEFYKDDYSDRLFEKFDDFSKNFILAYDNVLNFNKVLDKVLENYKTSNKTIAELISDSTSDVKKEYN